MSDDADKWKEMCFRLARHLRNTDAIRPWEWGTQALDLLVEVRRMDIPAYEASVIQAKQK